MEILDLLFYCVQQLGIILGVGGEALLLVLYLLAIRDTQINEAEEHVAHTVKRVITIALGFIVTSGIGITLIHFSSLQGSTVFEPAYLFKWSLIGLLVLISFTNRSITFSSRFIEGVVGGIWITLLLVHVLAPVTSWSFLGMLYAACTIGFIICWTGALFLFGGSKIFTVKNHSKDPSTLTQSTQSVPETLKQAPYPVAMQKHDHTVPVKQVTATDQVVEQQLLVLQPQPTPRPASSILGINFSSISEEVFPYVPIAINGTAILHPHLTAQTQPSRRVLLPTPNTESIVSIKESDVTEHLPAVRIMPRSPEDLVTQHRGPIIRFG